MMKATMNTPEPDRKASLPTTRRSCPRWLGAIICGVALPLAHGLGPWAISLLTVRHGWVEGRPGGWNWAGLILVAAGCAGVIWTLALHFTEAPQGWHMELTPKYLLTRGPYRYTRNPIFLAYAPLWFGWLIFYGSAALLAFCAVGWVLPHFVIVPREERSLEARFGEAYREYKRTVPRWLGKVGR